MIVLQNEIGHRRDLVVSGAIPDGIGIYRGIGSSNPAEPVYIEVGSRPAGMAAGDVNGDGRLDIVVTLKGDDKLAILLDDGKGTFVVDTTLTVGREPTAVAIRDINGDSMADLVCVNSASDDISVLLATAGGQWAPAEQFSVGAAPHSLVIDDWQGDGFLDLATAATNLNMISILKGDGSGKFAKATNFPVLVRPISMIGLTRKEHERSSLVVANFESDNVSVATANAEGALESTSYPAWLSPKDVGAGDVNRDKVADVVVINEATRSISLLFGNADNSFQAPVQIPLRDIPGALLVADLNSDLSADIAVSSAKGITVLLNTCRAQKLARLEVVVGVGTALYVLIALYLVRRGSKNAATN